MNERIRVLIKIVLAVLIFGPCLAQTRQPALPAQNRPGAPFLQQAKAYEETPYVTKIVLKNGMTVLVNEFRVQPVVSIQLYVRAGLLDSPPQNPDLARLAAAMAQRGAADKNGGTYRQKAQALGGVLTDKTDYSTTLFEIIAPSSQWKKALDDQAEAVLNPTFDQDSLKLEAKLVQGEARGVLDNSSEFAHEKLLELAFNQPRMGKCDVISSATGPVSPETLAGFYKTAYSPARMMLVVSGDVTSSDVLNEVVRLYVKPAGAVWKPASFPFAASQEGFRYRSIQGNAPIPSVSFGFHTVPDNDEDAKALEVLSSLLGSGEASVLSSRLKNQKKLVLSAQTNLLSYSEFGYLSINVKVNQANIDRSEIAVLTEMELLKREEPTEAEIERALSQLERSYWSDLETVSGRARALARFELLGDWKRMDRRISELRKVKPSDIRRAAAKYLRLDNCSLLEYLPASIERRQMTAEDARKTFATLISPSADQERAERDKEPVLAVKIPARTDSFKFNEIRNPPVLASLLRGPEMWIREDHSSPLLEMGLFFPAGKLDEKRDNAGITELMTKLILRGSADVSQLYRQLEAYGGSVRPVVTDDYFGFYLSVLSQNFEEAFKLLVEMIQEPNFDAEEVKRQKEVQSAEILSQKYSTAFPQEFVTQALFENFPYSLTSAGTEESLAAITPEALKTWYSAHVKNRKPVVAAIGDTKGTSIASLFLQPFSGSRIQDTKIPEGFAKPLEKGKSAEQRWDRSESLILVGFQAPPEDDEDGYAVAVLQGYADDPGRFEQELRDRLGLAHHVSVTYEPRLRGGSLIICAAADPENEEAALKALQEEIQRTRTGPITFWDFRSALNEAIGAYTVKQQSRSEQISAIAESVLAGKGIDGYQNYSAGLQEVREEDLKSIAQKILNLDRAVTLIMHGAKQMTGYELKPRP